jgi:hypothetical protein
MAIIMFSAHAPEQAKTPIQKLDHAGAASGESSLQIPPTGPDS